MKVRPRQVLYDACVDCAAKLVSYRNDHSRLACMLGNMRQKARTALWPRPIPAHRRAFAALPEEERAAMAALYAGLLPARELAEVMRISLEQLGPTSRTPGNNWTATACEMGEPSLEQAL